MKHTKNSKSFRRRTGLVCALTVAILLFLNVGAALLPSTLTKWDITDSHRYTLSKTSTEFVRALSEDVTITVLGQNGRMNESLEVFLSRYTALSDHVHVEIADTPVTSDLKEWYPGAETLSLHSMIVSSDRRTRLIEAESLEYYYLEELGKLDVESYQIMVDSEDYRNYLAGYGIDLTTASHFFAGEALLTGAMEYVTADTVPCFYLLEGDSMRSLGATAKQLLSRLSLSVGTLTCRELETSGIPADAAGLLIFAPTADLSENACEQVRQFLVSGGNLLLLTEEENVAMPRLMALMAEVGIEARPGILYEGNANRYEEEPTVLMPLINTEHEICSILAGNYSLLLPRAHGLVVSESLDSNVVATVLFKTSDATYTVAEDGTESDVGETAVGVALEDESTGARVVWIASADAFEEQTLTDFGQGSVTYLLAAVAWESKSFTSALPELSATDMTEGALDVTRSSFWGWTILLVGVIPAAVLLAGLGISVRRRKR